MSAREFFDLTDEKSRKRALETEDDVKPKRASRKWYKAGLFVVVPTVITMGLVYLIADDETKRKKSTDNLILANAGDVCSGGFENLNSVEACRAALDIVGIDGMSFSAEETNASWPTGCYYVEFLEEVFFNHASAGAVNGDARSICGKIGWTAGLANDTDVLFVGDSDTDYWDTSSIVTNSQNVGYGGYTCADVLGEIDGMLAVFRPSFVSVTCGENDLSFGIDVDMTTSNFTAVIAKINDSGARALTWGTKPEPNTTNLHAEYEEYDANVRSLATSLAAQTSNSPPLVMIDVYPSFIALGNPDSLYASDELHMSNEGYAYWETWVAQALTDQSCVRWLGGYCNV